MPGLKKLAASPNDEIQIVEFEPRHGPEVRRLVSGVHEEFGFSYDPVLDADLDRIEQVYGGRGGFWVAIVEGRVVGTAALLERSRTLAELKRMYLLPPYRGHGMGHALLRRVLDHACRNGTTGLLSRQESVSEGGLVLFTIGYFGAYTAFRRKGGKDEEKASEKRKLCTIGGALSRADKLSPDSGVGSCSTRLKSAHM